MNKKDIIEIFEDIDHSYLHYEYDKGDILEHDSEDLTKDVEDVKNMLKTYSFIKTDEVFNSDEAYTIVHCKELDFYIKIDHYYSSYGIEHHEHGTDIYEAKPKEKIIIEYEKV